MLERMRPATCARAQTSLCAAKRITSLTKSTSLGKAELHFPYPQRTPWRAIHARSAIHGDDVANSRDLRSQFTAKLIPNYNDARACSRGRARSGYERKIFNVSKLFTKNGRSAFSALKLPKNREKLRFKRKNPLKFSSFCSIFFCQTVEKLGVFVIELFRANRRAIFACRK